jgi:hypothetical protein
VDDYLQAIARAAEAGLECPPLRVVMGGVAAWGVPCASAEFLEANREPMVEQYAQALRERPRRERKTSFVDPKELAAEHLQNVRWPRTEAEASPTAVTLADVHLWSLVGGDGMEVPVLRVPLEAVEAWWIAGGHPLPAKKDRQWFFFGEFPLPSS